MTEEVKNKLYEFFESQIEKTRAFYTVIKDYFSEELTDLQLPTFSDFEEIIKNKRLEDYITQASDRNGYGSYSMDRDYYENHKRSPFLDSITDLGIIDYCTKFLITNMPTADILIKFPEVTVTNEVDRSINIQDLYVKIKVKRNKIYETFKMVRTTYDIIQWVSSYSHSHIPRLDNIEVPHWTTPCLGQGPLNSTVRTLKERYDEEILGLFCFELSKYVTVESLEGVPYIRLESVGATTNILISPTNYRGSLQADKFLISKFTKYFIENVPIKFSYINGNYALGEPLSTFWIKMSYCFIEWYNNMFKQGKFTYTLESLKRSGIINSFIISEGKVHIPCSGYSKETIEYLNNKDMFVFKGTMQKLNIIGVKYFNQNQSILVSDKVCEYILTCILKLINYKYGRTNKEATSSKKCFYL